MKILENCKLFKLNKIKTIYKILNIPLEAQDKNFDFDLLYTFKYLKKNQKNNGSICKQDRLVKYKNVKKDVLELLDNRPSDYNKSTYRVIININQEWLKKAQKKFHKILAKELNGISYLHSTIKHKSFSTNAHKHIGDKYTLAIDLKNFFTCISRDRLSQNLKKLLEVETDISTYYARLLTSPADKPPFNEGNYNLGQGLPSSPVLAFICNYTLFEYINDLARTYDIIMTIYVDDITFSCDKPIEQAFINKLFGLFKSNGMMINKSKLHLSKSNAFKKITGVNIIDGKPKIPSRKHEEIMVQYKMFNNLHKIVSFSDYLYFYNLYLKFTGNFQYLVEVECKNGQGKKVIKPQFSKYQDFIKEYDKFFPRGKNKKNKNIEYKENNLPRKDKISLEKAYYELKNYIEENNNRNNFI